MKLIPGSELLAVEERNGIVIIDPQKKEVIAKWNFRDNRLFSKLKSTYSGIQVWQNDNKTYIFWSAANDKTSYVLQAEWDGQKIAIKNAFPFNAEGKSPLALPNEVAVHTEHASLPTWF